MTRRIEFGYHYYLVEVPPFTVREEPIRLSEVDSQKFVESITNPPEPCDELRRAARLYNNRVKRIPERV